MRKATARRAAHALLCAADAYLTRLVKMVPFLSELLLLAPLRKLILSTSSTSSKPLDDGEEAFEVAQYSDMKQWAASILDTYIPRCRRYIMLPLLFATPCC